MGTGALTSMVESAVIRDITEGIVPQRQNIIGRVPFNLMKSETLVWTMQDVDYFETVVRRERRGSSHGLSIPVARGVYYRPGTFRSGVWREYSPELTECVLGPWSLLCPW